MGERMGRTPTMAIASLLLGLWLGGCTSGDRPRTSTEEGLTVVATSTILSDLVAEVGGDAIQLEGILEPGADPHVYEPAPADSVAFEEADLIFYNGYNLEPALIKLINSTGVEAQKTAVGEVVQPLNFDYSGQTVPDPHVWGDVGNAILMVNAIRDVLVEAAPEQEPVFTKNAIQLVAELEQLDTWVGKQIGTIPINQRSLVTTHDAFQYYSTAYGIEVIGTLIGISTEEQPSAQTVQTLVEEVKTAGVPAIFAETTINPTLIETVAQEAGVTVAPNKLFSDSIGATGSEGDSYIKMIEANTRTIVEALEGKYKPFKFAN